MILTYTLNTHYSIYCEYDKDHKRAYNEIREFDAYLKKTNQRLYDRLNCMAYVRYNRETQFKFVKVDGTVVDEKNYTVSEGSTVVTLKEDYLNTLAAGKHTFEIVWTDGLASTTFTVVKDNNNSVQVTGNKNESITVKQDNKNSIVTKTGDTANYVLYSILLMISFVGLVVTVKKIEMI